MLIRRYYSDGRYIYLFAPKQRLLLQSLVEPNQDYILFTQHDLSMYSLLTSVDKANNQLQR